MKNSSREQLVDNLSARLIVLPRGQLFPLQTLAEIETRYVPPKIPCIMHAQPSP